MTDFIGLAAGYLHYAVGAFAVGGVVLYTIIEKEPAAKSGPFMAIRWGVSGGSIPVCFAFIAAAFEPDLWASLQNYRLLVTVYGTYHLVQTARAAKPVLRAYFESKGWLSRKD